MDTRLNSYQKAIVVEGGALRSVFSAGVLDGFIEANFNSFDFYIGVSSGASNLVFYENKQHGKAYRTILDLTANSQFIEYRRFINGGHLLDLDWLFSHHLALEDIHLNHGIPLFVCVTNINTGEAEYLQANNENYKLLLKASMALPYVYRGFPKFNNQNYTDGGVADSIPIKYAVNLGAKNIIVIRARHYDYVKTNTPVHRFIRWKMKSYPELSQRMEQRVQGHTEAIHFMRNPPTGVNIIEVCPPNTFKAGRFTRNVKKLHSGYNDGLQAAVEAIKEWEKIL